MLDSFLRKFCQHYWKIMLEFMGLGEARSWHVEKPMLMGVPRIFLGWTPGSLKGYHAPPARGPVAAAPPDGSEVQFLELFK